ncbi:Do family serine endopeptidase [Methylocystis sp. L43]|jgi:serine protease Do|uniref:Do family serine endopeptidase n=1 Tax=unclassified Methylocystis TaxID=2625913 RepID=UPI0018C2E453|nr:MULTISPECIES: Do family serine endopeptidase [unclassified Methylocystis]MBG0796633.1 Do family serine endopeptidase [Methylocystis sp. L43]MBG0804648.1 Do family serine endopeptidase [Methylocystis sp. H15]
MTSALRRAARTILATAPALYLVVAPAQAKGPDSLSELSTQVSDAVVNISATTVDAKRSSRNDGPALPPGVGPGAPFDDLFEEFFRRRGQGMPEMPRQRRSSSLGSGFVIDPSGIVITNNHVIADANEVTVILNDGQKLKAEVLGKDQKVDVAVLKVKPEKPLKAVKFGDSDKAKVGDWVLAVGNPFGLGGSVTAGIVSARNRNIDSGPYDNYIQTDASINKGNSGGPLFNMDGEVIGINTAILSPSGGSVGIGFATPANTVEPVIEQLQAFGETRRGWLGVRIQNIDDAIAETLNLGATRGALVAGVDDKGPSKPAGLKVGDVIVKFDGKPIKESRDLPKLVAATPVGKDVELVVVRSGKEQTKIVKLGRLEDGEKVASKDGGDKEKSESGGDGSSQSVLGLELSRLSDALRTRYQIKDTVKGGVVITAVDPRSEAAEKRLQAGEVLLEVNQEAVSDPADVLKKIKSLKGAGKKTALLIVANGQGDAHFVALPVE